MNSANLMRVPDLRRNQEGFKEGGVCSTGTLSAHHYLYSKSNTARSVNYNYQIIRTWVCFVFFFAGEATIHIYERWSEIHTPPPTPNQ